MTKEEICKVLECCSSPEYRCNECPIDQKKKDDCECGTFGMGEALTLIKELTAENEYLKQQNEIYELLNERLEAVCESYAWTFGTSISKELFLKKERAATVREMQERLTSFFANDDTLEYIEVDAEYINEQVNQIAEQMIGETK